MYWSSLGSGSSFSPWRKDLQKWLGGSMFLFPLLLKQLMGLPSRVPNIKFKCFTNLSSYIGGTLLTCLFLFDLATFSTEVQLLALWALMNNSIRKKQQEASLFFVKKSLILPQCTICLCVRLLYPVILSLLKTEYTSRVLITQQYQFSLR